jgi:hypothetical protein
MNKEEIIKLAREAGAMFDHMTWVERDLAPIFERFAAFVIAEKEKQIIAANAPEIERINTYIKELEEAVAAEREACAKVCDVLAVHPEYASDITKLAALAIRARGNA